jgi:hypothetical protein
LWVVNPAYTSQDCYQFWPSEWMAWEQSLEAFAFRRGNIHCLNRLVPTINNGPSCCTLCHRSNTSRYSR